MRVEHFGTAALEDPTCDAETCPGDFQYAPESEGSGIGNVFQNPKWLAEGEWGRIRIPFDLNVAWQLFGSPRLPFPAVDFFDARPCQWRRDARKCNPRSGWARCATTICTPSTCASTARSRIGADQDRPGIRRVQPDERGHGAGD